MFKNSFEIKDFLKELINNNNNIQILNKDIK